MEGTWTLEKMLEEIEFMGCYWVQSCIFCGGRDGEGDGSHTFLSE